MDVKMMNDFTKEELEEIQGALVACKMLEQDYNFKLTDKIQSMIDSYCEHSDHHYYEDIAAAECKQCGMVMLP